MSSIFPDLEQECADLKESLSSIEKSIRKVTGNEPRIFKDEVRIRQVPIDFGRSKPGLKRKFHDIGDDGDRGISKRSAHSEMNSSHIDAREREQVLEKQKNNKTILQRNKRMFGSLVSTLEKFRQEEMKRGDSVKRVEIENKLDKAAEEEREAVNKEKGKLFRERKQKLIQLKYYEKKMEIIKLHKKWEDSQKTLNNFIETKAKPHVFYLPVKHNEASSKRLQETKDKYRMVVAEKRAKVHKELNEIEESYQKEIAEIIEQYGGEEETNGKPMDANNNNEGEAMDTNNTSGEQNNNDNNQVERKPNEDDTKEADNSQSNDDDLPMIDEHEHYELIYD